jgi:hypothetical protein
MGKTDVDQWPGQLAQFAGQRDMQQKIEMTDEEVRQAPRLFAFSRGRFSGVA